MKKFFRAIALIMLIVLVSGCSKPQAAPPPAEDPAEDAPQETKKTLYINNLTGEEIYNTEEETKLRPVAVMVNNQNDTRCHQTGLSSADIVFESYVEGGITRTLAVFKDIRKVGEIGTIRSARYDFVDLACSLDAQYVHGGLDPTYCQPYMRKLGLDNINMLEGRYYGYAYRKDNGHILEHTLYSSGEKIDKMLTDTGKRRTVKDTHAGAWQNFAKEPAKLTGGNAESIKVAFSADYKDTFKYDAEKDAYTKTGHRDGQKHSPAYSDSLDFKNVVVLFTTLGDMGNNYRVDIGLKNGSGYYFSKGTYQEIKWEKGGTYDSFKFTDAEGNPISYNPGNSWVCIVNRDMKNKFSFE